MKGNNIGAKLLLYEITLPVADSTLLVTPYAALTCFYNASD